MLGTVRYGHGMVAGASSRISDLLDVAGMKLHFKRLVSPAKAQARLRTDASIFVAWPWPGISSSSDLRLPLSDHIPDSKERGFLLIMNEEER